MNKENFNDAATDLTPQIQQQIEDAKREHKKQLKELEKEQQRRYDQDMEKAKRDILLEKKRYDLRAPGSGQKLPTARRLEEEAERIVEAQNLREYNHLREQHRQEIKALKNFAQRGHESSKEPGIAPKEIGSIFNGLNRGRDSHEKDRER